MAIGPSLRKADRALAFAQQTAERHGMTVEERAIKLVRLALHDVQEGNSKGLVEDLLDHADFANSLRADEP